MVLIRRGSDGWREPAASAFDNEKALQDLVMLSPSLLPGGESLAVVAELSVPNVGFIDLVGVGADGRIVIVECKLRANPEIRREVVGQVLAYASGLWRMPYENFEAAFVARSKTETSLHGAVVSATKINVDEADLQHAIAQNLDAGAFRLIVAVDKITPELRSIVEFLNEHSSDSIEILALELDYARDGDVELLSPIVYGAEAADRKAKAKTSARWTESSFAEEMAARLPQRELELLERLLQHGASDGHHPYYGAGVTPGMSFYYEVAGQPASVWQVYLYSNGARLALSLGSVANRSIPLAWNFVTDLRSDPTMARLLSGLDEATFAKKEPQLRIAELANDDSQGVLLSALDQLITTARQ
jgi:hypothetical protein